MRNKKWISLAVAVVLTVTALPATVFAAKDGESKEELTKVTLNEVAHSIFYAPQYVAIEEGYFAEEGLDLTLATRKFPALWVSCAKFTTGSVAPS